MPLLSGYAVFAIFQIPVAVAQNVETIMLGRFIGGFAASHHWPSQVALSQTSGARSRERTLFVCSPEAPSRAQPWDRLSEVSL